MAKKRYFPVRRVQEGELKFQGVYQLTRKGLEYLEFCGISEDEVRNYSGSIEELARKYELIKDIEFVVLNHKIIQITKKQWNPKTSSGSRNV